jgi:hypothetical protein
VLYRLTIVLAFLNCLGFQAASGADWINAPSYFTHDQTGQRVQQYTPIGPVFIYQDPSFQRSGYHHTRSSLQVGGSVDHYHQVEEWGRPVRPYDEWRFPYRPHSVPYDAWGPPYAGLGGFGYGFGGGAYPYFPRAQQRFFNGGPGFGFGFGGQQPNVPYRGYQPWFDDRYPAFDDRAPWRHQPHPQVAP